MSTIRLAIAGVGNCASSLVQGIEYYRDADPSEDVPGLMHVELGGYHVRDIEVVAAFDVDATNMDFMNMLERSRLKSKKQSKTQVHDDVARDNLDAFIAGR
jgi:myo-inositol-1-phosphate synthase